MQRIAYFGPSGTFAETALSKMELDGVFGGSVIRVPAPTIRSAMEQVRGDDVRGAIVPIESQVDGVVPATLDGLVGHPESQPSQRLQIQAETELEIAFDLVAQYGTDPACIRRISAFPKAFAQIERWLGQHFPNVEILPAASNAAAAEAVVLGHADAGVSTSLARRQRGLIALYAGIADRARAVTRFIYVTRPQTPPPPTGVDRTAIWLNLDDEPGSAARAFNEFAMRRIDLTFIESRPLHTEIGRYMFFLDCVGHIEDPAVADALMALRRGSGSLGYLGSWPACAQTGAAPPCYTESLQWLTDMRTGLG